LGYTLCDPNMLLRNSMRVKRDRCSRCQSPLCETKVRHQVLQGRKGGHTFESFLRCADINGPIPQHIVVIRQWNATSSTLARRRLDATGERVCHTSVMLIRIHAPLDLAARMDVKSSELLTNLGKENLLDRVLDLGGIFGKTNRGVPAFGDGDCDTTR